MRKDINSSNILFINAHKSIKFTIVIMITIYNRNDNNDRTDENKDECYDNRDNDGNNKYKNIRKFKQ